jgi:hypothetical protein
MLKLLTRGLNTDHCVYKTSYEENNFPHRHKVYLNCERSSVITSLTVALSGLSKI